MKNSSTSARNAVSGLTEKTSEQKIDVGSNKRKSQANTSGSSEKKRSKGLSGSADKNQILASNNQNYSQNAASDLTKRKEDRAVDSSQTDQKQSGIKIFGSTEFPWKWRLADLEKRPKNGCSVFSCFSCGGGSSMGYKLAGYDVIGNCEIDQDMMKVYKQNNHPKYSFLMDIRDFLKMPDEKIPDELFHLDVLDGSPPCSVFSTAGERENGWNVEKVFREGQAKQRLDDLFFFFIAVAKRLKPKVVIAENVRGLITGNAKGWVNRIIKAFDDAGYVVQIFLFNAARMGVPQKRERVFFIAHRKDLRFPKLKMDFHSALIPFGKVREPYGKAISENSLAVRLLKYRIPSDRFVADINRRVRRKMNSGFTNPINHDEEPAQTIVAGGNCYRMCDGLLMTDKDFINCQTFPQDYDFMDQDVQYICGMSVPPVMMARISEQVYLQWLKE